MNKFTTSYQEVFLDDILRFWIEAYQPKDATKIISWEAFVDAPRGKVVFKLVIDEKPQGS